MGDSTNIPHSEKIGWIQYIVGRLTILKLLKTYKMVSSDFPIRSGSEGQPCCMESIPALKDTPRPYPRARIVRRVCHFTEKFHCFVRFGADGVIRVDIGRADHGMLVDDIACRHGQMPETVGVEFFKIDAERQIYLAQIGGQLMD